MVGILLCIGLYGIFVWFGGGMIFRLGLLVGGGG